MNGSISALSPSDGLGFAVAREATAAPFRTGAAWAPEDSPAWKALEQDSGSALVVMGADGTLVYCSERFAAVFADRAPSDLLGRRISEVLGAAHGADLVARCAGALAEGTPGAVLWVWKGESMLATVRRLEPTLAMVTIRLLGVTAQTSRPAADAAPAASGPVDLGRLSCLTPREREVVVLIAQGLSTNEIAAKLHRTQKTVEAHRNSIGAKLGIKNRVQLALLALSAGLTSI